MLTDEQLQIAALKLCEIRGRHPREMIAHGPPPDSRGVVNDVLLHSPYVSFVKQEIRELLGQLEAIEFALTKSP